MISLQIVIYIIIVHWIADFVLQTDKMAKGKSSNLEDLLSHTIVYSGFIGLASCFFLSPYKHGFLEPSLFMTITFFCHTITDYFTSRLNSNLWSKGKTHYFFVSVGFDQILHYAQLFITYYLLTR